GVTDAVKCTQGSARVENMKPKPGTDVYTPFVAACKTNDFIKDQTIFGGINCTTPIREIDLIGSIPCSYPHFFVVAEPDCIDVLVVYPKKRRIFPGNADAKRGRIDKT